MLAALTLLTAGFLGHRWFGGNLGTVEPGRIYRSGQLEPNDLSRLIRERRIRTVLNLRGPNPDQPWYRGERTATLRAGATLIDVPLASDQWPSRAQAATLLRVFEMAEYPLLIHCQWGAERTGLASSMAQLLREAGSVEAAAAEFSAYYLYLPTGDGRVMSGFLDAYRRWLKEGRRTHSPNRFRRWLLEEYTPGEPSREDWPYDPYPLALVTRPTDRDRPPTRVARIGRDIPR